MDPLAAGAAAEVETATLDAASGAELEAAAGTEDVEAAACLGSMAAA